MSGMKNPPNIEDRFIRGSVYFIVLYSDGALTVPIIQTLIFIEKRERESIEYLFREVGARGEEIQFAVKEDHVDELVVDLKGLIERLGDGLPR